jgi:type IV secretion system protein VirB9
MTASRLMRIGHLARFAMLALLLPRIASADPLDKLVGGQDAVLPPDVEQTLDSLADNRPGGGHPTIPPIIGQDGSVLYRFGAQDPKLVCAPLRLCDIALQPGEEIVGLNCGDLTRWSIDPVYASGATDTAHVYVTPRDYGIETSLIITTSRNRAYHIQLIADAQKFMPRISFSYPDELANKLLILRAQRKQREEKRAKEVQRDTLPETGQNMGELSFAYDYEGRAPWKPVRTYNDGRKTTIQLPPATEHTEAPAFLEKRSDGDLFNDEELVQVPYRVLATSEGPRYIVDRVFDRGVLKAGVGRHQLRVEIKRLK